MRVNIYMEMYMQCAQRMLLLSALFLASASWFQAQSPAGTEVAIEKHASNGGEQPGTWIGMLDVSGTRLRIVLAMRSSSGGTRLLLGSGVN
jgi:hypothetical protein